MNEDSMNCAGYALDQDEWIDVFEVLEKSKYNKNFNGNIYHYIKKSLLKFTKEEIYDHLLPSLTQAILDFCHGKLIQITEAYDKVVNKYSKIIAFRIGIDIEQDFDNILKWDYDFHFRVFQNGGWTEKCGGQPISDCFEDSVYSPWDGAVLYDSPVIFFAPQEDKI